MEQKYICEVCDWVYDPAVGNPDNGIKPGTPFDDLPEDWVCPVCGVGKDQFACKIILYSTSVIGCVVVDFNCGTAFLFIIPMLFINLHHGFRKDSLWTYSSERYPDDMRSCVRCGKSVEGYSF